MSEQIKIKPCIYIADNPYKSELEQDVGRKLYKLLNCESGNYSDNYATKNRSFYHKTDLKLLGVGFTLQSDFYNRTDNVYQNVSISKDLERIWFKYKVYTLYNPDIKSEEIASAGRYCRYLALYDAVDKIAKYHISRSHESYPICLCTWLESMMTMEALAKI